MNFKQALATMAALGAAMAGQSALADVIHATDTGSAIFDGKAVGYDTGYITPNPDSSTQGVDVYIGGDSFTTPDTGYDFSATGQFNAWCVDIYHWMAGSYTYTVGTGQDLAAVLDGLRPPGTNNGITGTQRVDDLLLLAEQVYGALSTRTDSAAFQLAVWEIAYGTPDSGTGMFQIGPTDPNFNVTGGNSGAAVGLANGWLQDLNLSNTPKTGNYTLTYLHDGPTEGTQDVVVFTDPPATVPEPASLALLGIGLGGLGFVRRKVS